MLPPRPRRARPGSSGGRCRTARAAPCRRGALGGRFAPSGPVPLRDGRHADRLRRLAIGGSRGSSPCWFAAAPATSPDAWCTPSLSAQVEASRTERRRRRPRGVGRDGPGRALETLAAEGRRVRRRLPRRGVGRPRAVVRAATKTHEPAPLRRRQRALPRRHARPPSARQDGRTLERSDSARPGLDEPVLPDRYIGFTAERRWSGSGDFISTGSGGTSRRGASPDLRGIA